MTAPIPRLSDLSEAQIRVMVFETRGWTGCYFNERYATGIDPHGIERDLPDYDLELAKALLLTMNLVML